MNKLPEQLKIRSVDFESLAKTFHGLIISYSYQLTQIYNFKITENKNKETFSRVKLKNAHCDLIFSYFASEGVSIEILIPSKINGIEDKKINLETFLKFFHPEFFDVFLLSKKSYLEEQVDVGISLLIYCYSNLLNETNVDDKKLI